MVSSWLRAFLLLSLPPCYIGRGFNLVSERVKLRRDQKKKQKKKKEKMPQETKRGNRSIDVKFGGS